MEKMDLQEIGLSEGESEIYLALLKLGSSNALKLSKTTGRHRTHIYDTIEKLKEKGLISESIIENKKSFSASSPENILDYLKEKEEKAKDIVENLKKTQNIPDDVRVETYKGKEGLKAVLRDILREKKNYLGYGEGTRFEKILPFFFHQFRLESKRLKIHLKLILKKGVKMTKREGLELKYLDYTSPSSTFIYSNKVLIIHWEPSPISIKITDKDIAKSYENYFQILWKQAKS